MQEQRSQRNTQPNYAGIAAGGYPKKVLKKLQQTSLGTYRTYHTLYLRASQRIIDANRTCPLTSPTAEWPHPVFHHNTRLFGMWYLGSSILYLLPSSPRHTSTRLLVALRIRDRLVPLKRRGVVCRVVKHSHEHTRMNIPRRIQYCDRFIP